MSNSTKKITVQNLVTNFRLSLQVLAKCLDKVGIDLTDSYSGDAWDESAEVLYQYLIVEPISTSAITKGNTNFVLPKYEMIKYDYTKGSFLKCLPVWSKNKTAEPVYAFLGFLRRNKKFDKVRCYQLDSTLKICEEKIFLWKDLSFELVLLSKNGAKESIAFIQLEDS